MGYSKEQLLARKSMLENLGGGLSKNLFLKDKKHRFYIISALVNTNVDIKVLSQRLGFGKGGLRMAPAEALMEMLQANPTVSKDQPPDLAALVPSSFIVMPHQSELQPSSQAPADGNHASVEIKSQIVSEQVFKPSVSKKVTKEKTVVNIGHSSSSFADVGPLVEEILHKTSELLLSEIKEDTVKQHGEHLGTGVSDNLRKVLISDLKNLAMIFNNLAYTEGFHAGICWCTRKICWCTRKR
ncbi:unnamed protein product [Vicia faba]|uniref:YbaK/aminoacyl-tRNA synthetase-associated domain-containing protein n=1 Tax=Vicia faba TaxID=3906 RepID=A0AAV0YKT2_VICFA|nr:unnamed protein product [Vicia faba]